MGEYWKPVNVTRKEYIHPHRVDCGLKLPEWNWDGSGVRQIMDAAWPATDDVRAVSDYGGREQLRGVPTGEWPEYNEDALHEAGYRPITAVEHSKLVVPTHPTPDAQAQKLAEEISVAAVEAYEEDDTGFYHPAAAAGAAAVLPFATRLLSAEAAGQRQYEENVEQIKKQAALEARVKELEAGLAQAKDALKQIAENLAPCCSYECVEIAEAVLRALDLPGEGKEKA